MRGECRYRIVTNEYRTFDGGKERALRNVHDVFYVL